MALSQNDNPKAEKSPAQQAEDKQAEKIEKLDQKHADILAAAAASSDAAVHDLLGHRTIAELNQDEAALKEIDDKLAEQLKK